MKKKEGVKSSKRTNKAKIECVKTYYHNDKTTSMRVSTQASRARNARLVLSTVLYINYLQVTTNEHSVFIVHSAYQPLPRGHDLGDGICPTLRVQGRVP